MCILRLIKSFGKDIYHPLSYYNNCLKSSKTHQERRAKADHLCYGNSLPLFMKLEKLIQIPILISVLVCPVQKLEVWD